MPEVRADKRWRLGPFRCGVFRMGKMQRQRKQEVRYDALVRITFHRILPWWREVKLQSD